MFPPHEGKQSSKARLNVPLISARHLRQGYVIEQLVNYTRASDYTEKARSLCRTGGKALCSIISASGAEV